VDFAARTVTYLAVKARNTEAYPAVEIE